MKNKEKTEIVIPSGYSLDELLDLDGDLWDEKTNRRRGGENTL